jgi:hypothetical protein
MADAIEKVWLCSRITLQLLAMIPCMLWFMLSLVGIPGYLSAGFFFPVFCQITGCIICCLMLRSLWKRGREFRELFKIHINFDDWIDADDDYVAGPLLCVKQQVSRRLLDFHKTELKIAFAITFFLYAWSAWDWYLELYILRPAELEAHKDGTKCGCISPHVNANGVDACDEWSDLGPSCRPCGWLDESPDCLAVPNATGIYSCADKPNPDVRGWCGDKDSSGRCIETCCPSDPNCRAWVDKMTSDYPVLHMCPTVNDGYIGYATFSCHADGSWLMIVGTIALIYLVTLLLRTLCLPTPKTKIKAAIPVAKEIIGMEVAEEEKAIKSP